MRSWEGSWEAILVLRLVMEERMRLGKISSVGLVDLEKLFDNVDKMFVIFKEVGFDVRR